MNNYSMTDFLAYFQYSWIVHPRSGKIVRVDGVDSDGKIKFSDGESLSLSDIDWRHVQVPSLGWRSVDDGRSIYYVEKAPRRQAAKGVTPSAIVITMPPLIRQIVDKLSGNQYVTNTQLSKKLAEEIYSPTFTSLEVAVQKLTTNDHTVAVAISNYWAVSLSLHKQWPLVMWYKTVPVAHSKTGKSWAFNDKESKLLFNRSFANV